MTAWVDHLDRVTTARPMCGLVTRLFRGGSVSQGPRCTGAVALTFDDGPDPEWTPRVLDTLAEEGARATFFVVGALARRHPEIVRRAAAEGHEIAMHLYSHTRGVASDDVRFRDELRETSQVLADLVGHEPKYLRFPYGDRGRQRPRELRKRGVEVVHWTFSSHDSFLTDGDQVVRRVRMLLRPGAIVLLHDCVADWETTTSKYSRSRRVTIDALPAVLGVVRQRGLAPLTLSALLGCRVFRE